MKKIIKFAMCMALLLSVVGCSSKKEDDVQKVGIIKLMDHTSLNTIEDAIVKQLAQQNSEVEVIQKNAAGDTSIIDTIAKQLQGEKVDVIIAITTPVAQTCAPYADQIPVVFSAVTDPVFAGLTTNPEKPDLNITGTSDELALDAILGLMKETYPDAKSMAFLYNTGEANSVSSLEKMTAYAKDAGIEVIPTGVTSSNDIQSALAGVLPKVDMVFSPNDNTIAQAMSQVSTLCNEAKVPMFTGADSMVMDGGLMTYGINYENLGIESANMALQILEGTSVSDIPVKVFKDDLAVYVNQNTADTIGFTGIKDLQDKYEVEIIK